MYYNEDSWIRKTLVSRAKRVNSQSLFDVNTLYKEDQDKENRLLSSLAKFLYDYKQKHILLVD